MSITPEQRQQWREDAEAATYYGGNEQEQADRILALLDALGVAEQELDAERVLQAEAAHKTACDSRARAVESLLEAEATIARVRALADDLATREGMASSNMRDPDLAVDRSYYEGMRDALDLAETDLRAALDGDDR